jgi:hypothetical protein
VVEITRQATPGAFDGNKELLPCALVKPGIITPTGPLVHSARQTLTIYLYQRAGFEVIEQAAKQIYLLLHHTRLAPTNEAGAWVVRNIYQNIGLEDNALNCNLGLLRYEALIKRS